MPRRSLKGWSMSFPLSPLAEAALFLAGQSAFKTMNTDKALDNFGKVVKRNGPLQL